MSFINLRTTFGDLKSSDIPATLGLGPEDSRIATWANEAQQRLLPKGKWWGTVGRYTILATAGLITLPREIAVIESCAVSNSPVDIHDFWFEFVANGLGTIDESNPDGLARCEFRGRSPIISALPADGTKLRFRCDVAADVGVKVLVLGHDADGNWIRTQQNGVWSDGEQIALAQTPGTESVSTFKTITGIQFPKVMDGQSWLYSVTGNTLLGNYQYNETRPSYARYFFPSIYNVSAGSTVLVEALAKLEFVPVVRDSDYLVIGCLPALKEEMLSIKNKRNAASAEVYRLGELQELEAVRLLEEELDHYLGTGRKVTANFTGPGIVPEEIYNPL